MQPAAMSGSDYYLRLGLERDPFAADAMPDFFFVGAQRRFLVQRAVHALYFSGATVLLLGADGAGKTRTLLEIDSELKGLADICRIEATVLMDAAEIRVLLADRLGIPAAAASVELIHALERIRPADGDPQPVLIAIDSAHLLSIDTLAECAALAAGSGGRLRLLLAGQSDLATAWQQAQAGGAELLELKPLDRSETEDYVRTRLLAAGLRDSQPLSEIDFEQLFARSGGNFGAINSLVPAMLQPAEQMLPVARRLTALPMLHIGAVAALIAVVIVLLLYRESATESNSNGDSAAVPNEQLPAMSKTGGEQKTVALQLPTPAPSAHDAASPAVSAAMPIGTPVQPNSAANARTAPPAQAQPEPKTPPVAAPTAAANSGAGEAKPAVSAGAKKSSDASAASSPAGSADERALLGFPSSHYVVQLLGAESKSTVDKFARGPGRGLKLYAYRTRLRGKPWFIVVTGPFPTKNAAQAAVNKMPDAVRKQQPWPRKLANVQADIRAQGR